MRNQDACIERLWDNGRTVPVTTDEKLDGDWPGTPFTKGDDLMEVWTWFDMRHSKGLHYLMYEREGKDYTGEVCSVCNDETRTFQLRRDALDNESPNS